MISQQDIDRLKLTEDEIITIVKDVYGADDVRARFILALHRGEIPQTGDRRIRQNSSTNKADLLTLSKAIANLIITDPQ